MTAVNSQPVLAMRGVSLEFPTYRGAVQALTEVSIEVAPGEIVALVGESGSGKSVAAMAAIRLLPPKSFKITGGSIAVVGRDALELPARSFARLRGKQVSMVFQEPMAALNPTLRVGRQLTEVLRRHEAMDRAAATQRARNLLAEMRVPEPARVMRSYAFELSGGMRQRVLIAMAFACNPQLLIADEPTTALDVTVQAQVLGLLRERARAHGTAVLFISHDLAVVSQLCTRIYVMYAGQIVERGDALDVLTRPLHPYTQALLRSLPESAPPGRALRSISGTVPGLMNPPQGCRFRARCAFAQERCADPPPFSSGQHSMTRGAACWYPITAADADPERSDGREQAVGPGVAEGSGLAECPIQGAALVQAQSQGQAVHEGQDEDPGPAEHRVQAACQGPAVGPGRGQGGEPRALVNLDAVHVGFPMGKNWRGRPAMTVHALNGIDLKIRRGETLAIVGESGCGKSTLAHVVMSLLRPTTGRLCFDGIDLETLTRAELRRIRHRFQMVFQDPQASLDPRMPAWRVICEPLLVNQRRSPHELRQRAGELAALVGIRDEQLDRYPHQFSGGQRQRLAIARALALEPQLLVLDEPTAALDVSIQAQILNLLMELQATLRLTYLFISHNVAVVRHVAERVAVMYLGQIVELGPCASIIDSPRHPYTRQLIGAVPRLHKPLTIPPQILVDSGSNTRLPTGCYFRSRCAWSNPGCATAQKLRELGDGRRVRCHRAEVIEAEVIETEEAEEVS
jgi:peptide/nickel transport system ATP-binding protein